MATINYRFADGHTEAIEVTEEFAKEYANLEKEESKMYEREKKRRKNIVSLDLLIEKGIELPNEFARNPLHELLSKEEEKITLIELADFLTPRQKQVMKMYYENGYSKAEIAAQLGFNKSTVTRHIQNSIKKLLKNFCLK